MKRRKKKDPTNPKKKQEQTALALRTKISIPLHRNTPDALGLTRCNPCRNISHGQPTRRRSSYIYRDDFEIEQILKSRYYSGYSYIFFIFFLLFWLELFTVLTNHQPGCWITLGGKGYHGFFRWSFSCQLQLIFTVVLSNPRDMIVQGIFLLTPIALLACSFTFLQIVYFIHFPSTSLRWSIELPSRDNTLYQSNSI